ncbi:MAG: plasmid maintenance system antidote protein [Bacteroidales bacterium]|nr:plasmid maintenance system antidote protein [Bacteroidales bacterium]
MEKSLEILKGIHPGLILDRELRKRKLAKGRFAISVEEYPQTLGSIIKGRRKMNTELALRIENALGFEEGFLMMLQVYHDIKVHKGALRKSRPDLTRLRPVLFWDTDIEKIDWERQKNAVIERVFERGNEAEKNEIIRFYGLPDSYAETKLNEKYPSL